MQTLKLLKKYLIDSQIFVSLMGTLLAVFFMWHENNFKLPTIFLIFITYFGGYIYTKFQQARFFRHILFVCAIGGLVCVYLIIQNHNIVRLYKWFAISVLGLLYNSSFLASQIRKVPLLKIFYVGMVWGLMNAWLSFEHFNFAIFTITFLFVTALILPFDIRDMKSDTVITFPQLMGVQRTKYLAYFMIFVACCFASVYLESLYAVSFFLTSVVTSILVYFSENKNPDAYFSVGVESCSGLPLFFLLILEYLY
jgi:hypothetical protein